jgi:hypothetical protein
MHENFSSDQHARITGADVFTEIYSANTWADEFSRSGSGSTLSYTQKLRMQLQKLLVSFSINSMLDAPCGDLAWMSSVNFPANFAYIGGDIVRALIDDLRAKYGSNGRTFVELDVRKDRLPSVDLWLCRDCLIHFSNRDAISTLHNFVRSDIKFMLTTTYNFGHINTDIITGHFFRPINLRRPPFCLPRPLKTITDYVYPFAPRRLGLWSQDQLRTWVA